MSEPAKHSEISPGRNRLIERRAQNQNRGECSLYNRDSMSCLVLLLLGRCRPPSVVGWGIVDVEIEGGVEKWRLSNN